MGLFEYARFAADRIIDADFAVGFGDCQGEEARRGVRVTAAGGVVFFMDVDLVVIAFFSGIEEQALGFQRGQLVFFQRGEGGGESSIFTVNGRGNRADAGGEQGSEQDFLHGVVLVVWGERKV